MRLLGRGSLAHRFINAFDHPHTVQHARQLARHRPECPSDVRGFWLSGRGLSTLLIWVPAPLVPAGVLGPGGDRRLFSGTLSPAGRPNLALAREGCVVPYASHLLQVPLHVEPKKLEALPRIERPREVVRKHHVLEG